MKQEYPKRQKGFTLLELLVTIAILGILVVMAAPSFRDMIERQKIRAALNEWQGAFFFAQKEAMRLKEPVRLCASHDGTTCSAGPESRQFNRGWIVLYGATMRGAGGNVVTNNIVLRDYAFNEPSISIFMNRDNGLIFRSNGSIAGVNNDGNMAGGFFAASIGVGAMPAGGGNVAPDPDHRNTVTMNISSAGRLAGARR